MDRSTPASLWQSALARFTIQAMVFAVVSYPPVVMALAVKTRLMTMPLGVTIAFSTGFVAVEAALLVLVATLFDADPAITK